MFNRKVLVSFGVFLAAVALLMGGFFIGNYYAFNVQGKTAASTGRAITQLVNKQDTYQNIDLSTLWNVWGYINSSYLKISVDNETLYRSAIKGLVGGLNDPYTTYLTAEELATVTQSDSGNLQGIGVSLRQEGDYTVIESVIDGYPASKNGVKANDVIMEVDGVTMKKVAATDVAAKIKGNAGTVVQVSLYRPSTQETLNLKITREDIHVDNISIGENRNGVVVLKIYKFTDASLDSFNAMWDKVASQLVAMKLKGIIIDLRGNPGGYVSGAEYILNDFIANGKVIFLEEDRDGNKTEHVVNRIGRLLSVPIDVIVNEGTASASEIMAAAIQDNGRGQVIGESTVGKGVEQQLINLADGSQLRLVFRKWLTPNGNNISADSPIKPNIVISDYTAQTDKAYELLK